MIIPTIEITGTQRDLPQQANKTSKQTLIVEEEKRLGQRFHSSVLK
jgi:hypothetical protein